MNRENSEGSDVNALDLRRSTQFAASRSGEAVGCPTSPEELTK
eukprot:CAMPEP_0196698646 /NCGR_PEP_ID=MMETSP1090-20130531/45143_1 /TAXON_ID=37098 /ORGANISM="Isochrysis sp, Strain CCMP1244" /LENGTH=42 /DNA_ID= /DNA_START= /DNA_END= /DNA_ORIENTATION=